MAAYTTKVARKVKGRSKAKSSLKGEERAVLEELRTELLALHDDLRTSTVSFCRARLQKVNNRLEALLDGPAQEARS